MRVLVLPVIRAELISHKMMALRRPLTQTTVEIYNCKEVGNHIRILQTLNIIA